VKWCAAKEDLCVEGPAPRNVILQQEQDLKNMGKTLGDPTTIRRFAGDEIRPYRERAYLSLLQSLHRPIGSGGFTLADGQEIIFNPVALDDMHNYKPALLKKTTHLYTGLYKSRSQKYVEKSGL
tara:strand:- start:7 stop:378 length:372 start_codon:yes stop_codon:yes gene_type:complete